MTVVEWCVSGAKDLRFIGRECQKWGEELRGDRSASLSLVEGLIFMSPVKVLWFNYMEEVVCNGNDLLLNSLFNFKPMKGLEHWGERECLGV